MGIEKQVTRESIGSTQWLQDFNTLVHQVSRDIVAPEGGESLYLESFDDLALFVSKLAKDPERLIRDSEVIDIDENQSKIAIYFEGYPQSRLALKYKEEGLTIALERKLQKGSYKGESWISLYPTTEEFSEGSNTIQIIPSLDYKKGNAFDDNDEVHFSTTAQLSPEIYATARESIGSMLEQAKPHPFYWVRHVAETADIIAKTMVAKHGRDKYSEDVTDIARFFESCVYDPDRLRDFEVEQHFGVPRLVYYSRRNGRVRTVVTPREGKELIFSLEHEVEGRRGKFVSWGEICLYQQIRTFADNPGKPKTYVGVEAATSRDLQIYNSYFASYSLEDVIKFFRGLLS